MWALVLLVLFPHVAVGRFDEPDLITPCSLDTCFDTSRCKKALSIYIYPTPHGQERPYCYKCASVTCHRPWYQACFVYTLLTSGFTITRDPKDACLFVSPFDLCPGNSCDDDKMEEIEAKLHSLPYWNGGENHIVWNYWNDWPSTGYDVGKAIVISPSFINQTYRPGFDVALPLSRVNFMEPEPPVMQTGWKLRVLLQNATVTHLVKPITQGRDILLYFRGSIPAVSKIGTCEHRSIIFGRFFPPPKNISDVHIEATCQFNHTNQPAHLQVAHCNGCINNRRLTAKGMEEPCTASKPSITYEEGLARTKFAFAPRGCGSQTFRVLEAIGFGAVPVISGLGSFRPFAGEGHIGRLYERCIIHVPEENLGGLIPRLRAMSEKEYHARLAACLRVASYEGYSLKVLARQSICMIAARVASELQAKGGVGMWGSQKLQKVCKDVGVLDGSYRFVTSEIDDETNFDGNKDDMSKLSIASRW